VAPLVSIVIPNWNGRTYLETCLASLKSLRGPAFEIVLVDNGSTDDSLEFVEMHHPDVRIVRNTENLGFARACNIGIEHSKGEYILFLNNDTLATPDFLTELVRAMEADPSVGMCQSKLRLVDHPELLDQVGSYFTTTGFLLHEGFMQRDGPEYERVAEIFSAKGACMLVPRRILDEVGPFDEDFFAYCEEYDLCWRIWLAGYRIIYVPRSVIYHKMGATSVRLRSAWIDFHSFKNRVCLLIKNLGGGSLIWILPIHLALCVGGSLLLLAGLKYASGKAILQALVWNMVKIRSTIAKRKYVQTKIRKISDRELFERIAKRNSFGRVFRYALGYFNRW
jgi:GT2 family glycosyltransferase